MRIIEDFLGCIFFPYSSFLLRYLLIFTSYLNSPRFKSEIEQKKLYLNTNCFQLCDEITIIEFGQCGSFVNFTQELANKTTLDISFNSVENLLNENLPDKTYAIVIYTEDGYIQWLVLFHDLKLLRSWNDRVGHHEPCDLYYSLKYFHQDSILPENELDEKWFVALISLKHWSYFPVIGEESPLRIDFLRPIETMDLKIIAVSYYNVINLQPIKLRY